MTINLSVPEPAELHPKITVIGVGGAGGNAVNNMIDAIVMFGWTFIGIVCIILLHAGGK